MLFSGTRPSKWQPLWAVTCGKESAWGRAQEANAAAKASRHRIFFISYGLRRGPKMALPMRTWVDPQATAMGQSSDIPMDSSLKSVSSGKRSLR